MELLSPVGNMECLYAAIMGGADAVYLAGKMFGARAFAGNFTDEELEEAVKISHLYNVKVYVTCNILVWETEVDKFMKYISFLNDIHVDGLIMQDLGMVDLVHKTYPDMDIHASTQMHIHNLDGVKMCEKLGLKRVVLARETPIDVIKDIQENTSLELEIFAHGALCVSYSGECLFSSLIGNRSGNRGSCVGSCRLPYDIIDENNHLLNNGNYPLSMKDLYTLPFIGELIDINVSSIKIEGRMKSKEYVYTVTKLYREAIDSYIENKKVKINNKLLDNLKRIFSRSYTKGYLFNEDINDIINPIEPNHQGVYIGKVINVNNLDISIKLTDDISINDGLRIKNKDFEYGFILNNFYLNKKLVKEAGKGDLITLKVNKKVPVNSLVYLTKDASLIKEIDEIIDSHNRFIPINLIVNIRIGKPLEMVVTDYSNTVKVTGNEVLSATNKPLDKKDLISKMNKIKDTVYKYDKLTIKMDPNSFIPISHFNELRRELFNKLDSLRLNRISSRKGDYSINLNDFNIEHSKSILINNNYRDNLNNYDYIYSENNNNYILKLEKVMSNYDNLDPNKEYLVGELGAFNKLNNINCDFSFNVTNSYTVALLHSLGAKRICLSLELIHGLIKNLIDSYHNRYHMHPNLEVIRSGYREVMTLKTNLNKVYNHDKLYLLDRFKNKYLIRNKDYISIIYDYHYYEDYFNYYDIGVNTIRDNQEISENDYNV